MAGPQKIGRYGGGRLCGCRVSEHACAQAWVDGGVHSE